VRLREKNEILEGLLQVNSENIEGRISVQVKSTMEMSNLQYKGGRRSLSGLAKSGSKTAQGFRKIEPSDA
jgi:predicted transcriptional regulator